MVSIRRLGTRVDPTTARRAPSPLTPPLPPSHPRLSSPLAAFLLALHDAGASGEDVFADSDHADFISREAFTRENPNERDALARDRVVPRLAEHHHASHRVRHDSHDRPRTSIADDSSDPFDANPDLPRRESVEDRHDADPFADPFAAFAEPPEDECHATSNAEFWGPNTPGLPQGVDNFQSDAGGCCASCASAGPDECNAWQWDPSTNECFRKKLQTPYQPMVRNANVRFTSGAIYPEQPKYLPSKRASGTRGDGDGDGDGDGASSASSGGDPSACLHTMITSNGQPYMNWQTRVFYQTWLKAKDQPGSPLAHFTRVLHRTRDDELTLEVPTVRIDPTHPECDDGCDYAVKDRARAIAAWTTTEDARRCSHVLMAEADYLLVRSPPPSVMLARGHAYGFLFGYIIPWHADAAPASRVLHDPDRWGVPMEDVPQSGNAPQVIHVDDLAEVAPTWADLVELGESSKTVRDVFGWVRDMYAFDFAAARVGLRVHYPPVPHNKLMVQPPADDTLGAACLMHYTWSPILSDKTGAKRWEFDKRGSMGAPGSTRHFTVLQPVRLPPEWDPDAEFKLQAGEVVTEEGLGLMRTLAETFNDGVARLSRFPKGCKSAADVAEKRG